MEVTGRINQKDIPEKFNTIRIALTFEVGKYMLDQYLEDKDPWLLLF